MFKNCGRQEWLFLGCMIVLGGWLRFANSSGLAVEHFDEGIYWSATWYDGNLGDSYPARYLYAPALLPTLISWLAAIPGCQQIAPFLPSMLLGTLSIFVFWWVGRMLFGSTAGYVASAVVAFNDVHILYSRMALTDIPVLTFTVAAIGCGAIGISRQCLKTMFLTGVLAGIGWWFKYTGWLPLAVLCSSSAVWWLFSGRRSLTLITLLKLWATMIVTASIIWCPWLWSLQAVGGYSVVQANHEGYVQGLSGWQDRLAQHLTYQFMFDSWVSAAAIALSVLIGGTSRWFQLRRSTWNAGPFPPEQSLLRIIIAAVLMGMMSLAIHTPLILICLAVGGIAGLFLFPVLTPFFEFQQTANAIATDSALPFVPADRSFAPRIPPSFSFCIVFVWLMAMLYVTPQYTTFPRLSLTMMSAFWLAAAGGIAWWVEAVIHKERLVMAKLSDDQTPSSTNGVLWLTTAVVLMLGVAAFKTLDTNPPKFFAERTSLRSATWELAEVVLEDQRGEYQRKRSSLTPEQILNDELDPASRPNRRRFQQEPLTELLPPNAVIYAIGEPAVLGHLFSAGLVANPVTSTAFPAAEYDGRTLPTYLVVGPNTLRSPGFIEQWLKDEYRFRLVEKFPFFVSKVVALNLFSTSWLKEHPEAYVQKLELYRLVE